MPRYYSAELRGIIESMMHKDVDMRPSLRQILNHNETLKWRTKLFIDMSFA